VGSMTRRLTGPLVLVASLAQPPRPVLAHHSAALANFDFHSPVTLVGPVVVFHLVNPHASIEFDVLGADDEVRRWSIELGSASSLRKSGWNDETLKLGQEI